MPLRSFTETKYAYHLTYPKLTAIVTSGTLKKPNAMAASWHTHLSLDPPLYGVSISPKRYTNQLIREYREFGVNFLPFKLSEKIWLTGTVSGREVNKFSEFELTIHKAKRIKAPLISESIAALECKVVNEITVGDHIFYVGEIVYCWVQDDVIKSSRGLLDPVKAKQAYYLGEGVFLTLDPTSLVEFE